MDVILVNGDGAGNGPHAPLEAWPPEFHAQSRRGRSGRVGRMFLVTGGVCTRRRESDYVPAIRAGRQVSRQPPGAAMRKPGCLSPAVGS